MDHHRLNLVALACHFNLSKPKNVFSVHRLTINVALRGFSSPRVCQDKNGQTKSTFKFNNIEASTVKPETAKAIVFIRLM